MGVRNEESGKNSALHFLTAYISLHGKNKLQISRNNPSFEKKIERLWLRSNTVGWNYNDFVVHLLEVLVVLRRRDSLKRAAASKIAK